jgi:hypothetical protein
MIEAAVRARGAASVTAPGVFDVAVDGTAAGDFSFLVIGDPGEGDSSQHALRDQLLLAARRNSTAIPYCQFYPKALIPLTKSAPFARRNGIRNSNSYGP